MGDFFIKNYRHVTKFHPLNLNLFCFYDTIQKLKIKRKDLVFMPKIPVILVVLNRNQVQNALTTLNFNSAQLLGVVTETGDGQTKILKFDGFNVPMFSFSAIGNLLIQFKNAVWLISGTVRGVGDIYRTKKFLMSNGVPEDNIVNFEVISHITPAWIANIRYIEKYPVEYFSTGISYTEAGLNFHAIMRGGGGGINLASSNQDLRQGYLTAKYVFEHAKPNTIKFVLIGLTPYSFRYDNIKAFAVCPRNLQYVWILKNSQDNSPHGQLLNALVSDEVKNHFLSITAEQADKNFDGLKNSVSKEFPANALVTWEDELDNLTKKFFPETVQQNLQILEDYIKLCLKNGAKPVGVVFPFAPMMHDNYDKQLLISFRMAIEQLKKIYDFKIVDMFDLRMDYSCFYNMAHINLKGSMIAGSVLSALLHNENILPFENLCKKDYQFFDNLTNFFPKDFYNSLIDRVLKITAEKIRRKNKIKFGFVLYDSSMWCGDALYNIFAKNKRYEVTIFLCLRTDKYSNHTVIEDFKKGIRQFRNAGLNVVSVADFYQQIPKQDLLMYLTPYDEVLPNAFRFQNITAETLTTYIQYSLSTADLNIADMTIFKVAWKIFFETTTALEFNRKRSFTGLPRSCLSGYPRMDLFFGDTSNLNYDWKIAAPNAKKIIWAPHFSIGNRGVQYSTFDKNYKFLLEIAKRYPQISWVVKPHPNLLFSAVEAGIFPSEDAFNDYLNEWNNLPNAKVETGGYYQPIFTTSDGMILDSGSFIAEYQYTHKPLIFLTRDTQKFNDLGNDLMKILYRVDGGDLNGIAELIQKIFIEGNDELFDARLKFFDEHFNYKKFNGMLASEYIFKQISKEIE